jgi:hypothetical protein
MSDVMMFGKYSLDGTPMKNTDAMESYLPY